METTKKALLVLGFFSLVVGCSAPNDDRSTSSRSDRVVLDVRCNADSDCPTGFECEIENEHGTSMSYCKSHQSSGAASGSSAPGTSSCPPGFEQETEHGGVFCKPHGGDDDGHDGGAASTGSGSAGAACTTDADCAAGLECETELEHGVTTSFCKAHGGGNGSGKN